MNSKSSGYRFVVTVFDCKHASGQKITEEEYIAVIGNNKYNLSPEELSGLSTYLINNDMIAPKAVGPQYRQDVLRQVQNPNHTNVKDTKNYTHVNKNKLQKSKKKNTDDKVEVADDVPVIESNNIATASMHLNEVIENLKAFEDEFLPAWKKFKASGDVSKELLSTDFINILAQDFSNYEQGQRAILTILDAYSDMVPENAAFENPTLNSMFYRVDPQNSMGIVERIKAAVSKILDKDDLYQVYREIYNGAHGDFPVVVEQDPNAEQVDWRAAPEQEFEMDEGESLELDQAQQTFASMQASKASYASVGVDVDGNMFDVLVAEDSAAKVAGLEVLDEMAEGEGMLFPFYPQQSVTFHMGSVAFPIDILFLIEEGNNLVIGDLVENAKPGSEDKWTSKAKYVLEISGDLSEKLGLSRGAVCTLVR